MHFLNSKNINILPLYNKIVFLTRDNLFYKEYNLLDSFSNRIYLIFFHLSFLLIVLKKKEYSKKNSQLIFDFFIKQIEVNFRELGYGDTYINKKMKLLIKLFYEILFNCQKWRILSKNNKNELFFKFLNSDSNNKILTRELTKYFDNFLLFIEDMTLNSLTKGVFNFNYKE